MPGRKTLAVVFFILSIGLITSALVLSHLVDCNGGAWFGFLAMTGGNITTVKTYTSLTADDTLADPIASVANLAWPSMAMAMAGLLFTGLILGNMIGESESERFEVVLGVLAVLLFLMSAAIATALPSHAGDYTGSSCVVGRDTYMLWGGAGLMICGTRSLMQASGRGL